MVTRGFLGFVFKDRSTRGCRQQYDTYPTGLGQWIVDFLRTLKEDEFDLMAERMDAIEWQDRGHIVEDPKVLQSYTEQGFAHDQWGHINSTFFIYDKPWPGSYGDALNHLGTNVSLALTPIKEGKLHHLIDQTYWELDDCCEWAYWLDFHCRTLTVRGYNFTEIASLTTCSAIPSG